ncbi:MAG: hypothetical protein HY924_06555 [Elusimicrobia bacterium]|nr:hypothetical protein [Elusimicrobiota bacterium]
MVRAAFASVLGAVLMAALSLHAPGHRLCSGFLPENNLRIDVGSFEDKGITEAQFNRVLDVVEKIYKPVVAAKGATLVVERKWDDGTVNAYAQQQGGKWMISMFGGLARHSAVTQDGFALVACHEMSHHLGGAPKSSGWFGGWATIEGQADYGANLKCLRRVFAEVSAKSFTRPVGDDPVAVVACEQAFSSSKDRAICLRGAMAGKSVSALFKALSSDPKDAEFNTPDPAVVTEMDESHPATQCRLDTYLQGSICAKPLSSEVSDKDVFAGTCNRKTGQVSGLRPLCWYKPPKDEPAAQSVPAVMAGASKILKGQDSALSTLAGEDLWKGL